MRKSFLLLLAVVLYAAVVYASVTLAPANQQTVQIGGVTVDTVNVVAATDFSVNFQTNTLSFTVGSGVMNAGALVVSNKGQRIVVTIDANAGTWTDTNGGSGTLTSTQKTNVQNYMKNLRNNLETIGLATGSISGTQVTW